MSNEQQEQALELAMQAEPPKGALDAMTNAGFSPLMGNGKVWAFMTNYVKSSMCPKQYKNDVNSAMAAIQFGHELGFKPFQALNAVAVINGTPALYGDGLWALIKSAPDLEGTKEWQEGTGDDMIAHCMIIRGKSETIYSFGVQDAKTAGLWKKAGPWTQYPRRMLQMRARMFASRDAYPDRLRGFKSVEELNDYSLPQGTATVHIEKNVDAFDDAFLGRQVVGGPKPAALPAKPKPKARKALEQAPLDYDDDAFSSSDFPDDIHD